MVVVGGARASDELWGHMVYVAPLWLYRRKKAKVRDERTGHKSSGSLLFRSFLRSLSLLFVARYRPSARFLVSLTWTHNPPFNTVSSHMSHTPTEDRHATTTTTYFHFTQPQS